MFPLNSLSFAGVIWVLVNWKRVPLFKSALPSERLAASIRTGLRYVRYAPSLPGVVAARVTFTFFLLGGVVAAGGGCAQRPAPGRAGLRHPDGLAGAGRGDGGVHAGARAAAAGDRHDHRGSDGIQRGVRWWCWRGCTGRGSSSRC